MDAPMVTPERIVTLTSHRKTEALTELVDLLAADPAVEDRADLLRAILQREQDLSTAMGFGFAVPHAKIFSVKQFIMAIGLSPHGIAFDAIDGLPVHLVLMIAGPADRQWRYLQLLRQITTVLKNPETRALILSRCDPDTALDLFATIR